MRGEDAKSVCPEFQTFYVNQKRGKADLTKYRNASLKIFEVISKYSKNLYFVMFSKQVAILLIKNFSHIDCIVEKASIDEAYLDLTDLVLDRIRNKTVDKVEVNQLTDSFAVGSFMLDNNTGVYYLKEFH